MTLFLFLVWLQMSAQPQVPCQSAKLYYNGVLVDEEPHCGLLNQVINMPTALDDITRAEFAEAAQRAADETDGKPPKKWGDSGNGGGKPGYACIPGDERKECAAIRAESAVDVPDVQESREVEGGYNWVAMPVRNFPAPQWPATHITTSSKHSILAPTNPAYF